MTTTEQTDEKDPDVPEVGDPVSVVESTEQMLQEALRITRATLKDRRARRDAFNAEIRQLVAEEATLTQALGPFIRARKTKSTENGEEP